MPTFGIIGVTGYSGGNIAREAVSRGHRVIGLSRHAPAEPVAGVEYRTGSMDDRAVTGPLFADADVVVIAVHGTTPDGAAFVPPLVPGLIELAAEHGTRLGVVGGAGSLLVAEGGPRLLDAPGFPDSYKGEAQAMADVLDLLRAGGSKADWFLVSPGAMYGGHMPGTRTGSYRTGGDLLLSDADGNSSIGGEDFAIAFVDEIEKPAHRNERFTVAY